MSDLLLEGVPFPDRAATVLVVSSCQEHHATLRDIVERFRWRLHPASTCGEALEFLRGHSVPVVICDCKLPDGGWKECLERAFQLANRPVLIVFSRLADQRLWAEVLNFGAYDLLSTPFDATEVLRVMHSAWISWKNERERYLRQRKSPGPEQGVSAHPGSKLFGAP